MTSFASIMRNSSLFLAKNSPAILTGIGAAGVVSTAVLAVRATPEAMRRIDFYNLNEPSNPDLEGLPVKPTDYLGIVRHTWKLYIPALAVGTVSIVCIIEARSIDSKRNAALLSVYALTEKAMAEYKAKVLETIGEKKEEQIRDGIAQDHLDKNPLSKTNLVVPVGGETLCYDVLSGRYFKSDFEKLRKAENDLNKQLFNDTWVDLNMFYDLIGLEPIKLGDEIGWVTDNMVELKFSAKISDDGQPCIVVDYQVDPKVNRYSR